MKCLLIFLLLFVSTTASSQVKIRGSVLEEGSKKPIEGVAVYLKHEKHDSGVITDSTGTFILDAQVGFTYELNFQSFNTKALKLQLVAKKDTTFQVFLEESDQLLETFTVQGRQQLMESRIDRLVYHIESDPLAATLSTEELLRRVPLLRIRDDMLSIVGKGKITVTVNGKIQQLGSNELLSFLNSFDPSNLKSIEVITSPPANFSAEGNAGVLNIVTRSSDPNRNDWNASIRSGIIQRSLLGFDNAVALNYHKNRFTVSSNFFYNLTRLEADLFAEGNEVSEQTNRRDKGRRLGAYVNLGYQITPSHEMTASFQYLDAMQGNVYSNLRKDLNTLETQGERRNDQDKWAIDFQYIYRLDSTGKRITSFLSFNDYQPRERFDAITHYSDTGLEDHLQNKSRLNNQAFSTQLDAYFPYSIGTLEYGLQYFYLTNNSRIDYNINDSINTDLFNYKEHNYATYISFLTRKIHRLQFKGGLRYEYNQAELHTEEEQSQVVNRRLGNFFPTFYVRYEINDESNFSVNYSRRINRPRFSSITPFRWYNNTISYVTGNPFLLPFISDMVQGNYSLGNVNLSLYSQWVNNGYSTVDFFDDPEWRFTYENYFNEARYGFSGSYLFDRLDWWELDFFANLYHNRMQSTVDYVGDIQGNAFTYELNNRFFLDSKQQYTLSINYWQDLPFYENNTFYRSFASLDIGFNASYFDKKLNISVLATDLGRQSITRSYSEYNQFTVFRREYFDARMYRLTLRYRIGSSTTKSVSTPNKFRERERMN
ncbi:TonB-dependent receptor domain-containing protein [Litoribacter populi]|uniref:TonB-dependent receptor domain-containing protein n=1 Tax=Litoribacter populi TaxID=2598460 RepID=UPI00117FAB98|nr:TonB-dependent receptor [Litoribacter populi]